MTRLSVRVQPGAKSDAIAGWFTDPHGGDVLRVRLRAAAIEGKANAALVDFLARALGVRSRQVSLDRGARSREKVVLVEGLTLDEIKKRTASGAEN